MNELFFNWHKSLNIKKVIITILVIVTFILLIVFLSVPKEKVEEEPLPVPVSNPEKNTTSFFDKNKSISIELSNTYNLEQYIPTSNYLLELRANSNLNIFTSAKDIIQGRTLKDVVSADRLAYTENFENISNLSDIKELLVNNIPAYTYSFHYLDKNLNTTFYIQITWMELNNKYYIFDIEFPLDNLTSYTNIITDTLSSFKTLK